MVDRIIKSWKLITVIIAISATSISANAYFARNVDFQHHLIEHTVDEALKRIRLYESQYQCIGIQACQSKMPPAMFEDYRKLLIELERMEKKNA